MLAIASVQTAGARTSCPLSTTVPPFAESVSDRYEIVTTDGGSGDLDGAADGTCQVVVNVCRADASLCGGVTLDRTSVRVVGRRSAHESLALLEGRLNDELAALAGSSAPCRPLRIDLSADDGIALRFLTDASSGRGRHVLRRSRLGLTCRPASEASSDARCNGRRGCPPPGTAVCGNGLRDAATERCDGADDATCPGMCRADCSCGIDDDDLAPEAVVTASSSAADSAPDFAVDGVVDGWPGKTEHEWSSSGEGAGAWLKLEWPQPVRMGSVVLYDRPNVMDNVTGGALFVDDDPQPIATGALAPDGSATPIAVGDRSVRTLTFLVTKSTGQNAGLAEIKVKRGRARPPETTTTTTSTSTSTTEEPTTSTSTTTSSSTSSSSTLLPTSTSSSTTTSTTTTTHTTSSTTSTSTSTSTQHPTTTSTSTSTSSSSSSSSSTSTSTTTSSSSSTAATVPPTTTTLPPPTGATYYIAPNGNDASTGKSANAPWKTFAKAVKALVPGDTLVLGDGKYTRDTNGMPLVDCANGAKNGTADKPITIRAAHERKAWLANNGIGEAVYVNQCAWWNVVGVYASSADNTAAKAWEGNVMRIVDSNNVQVRRSLVVRPNRTCPNPTLTYCNAHGIAIEDSHHILVEESEIYDFHRHGVSAFSSRFITVRRCYMNPWDATGGAGGGSTGVILYGSSDSIVENVVGEGVYGLNIAGGTTYDGSPGGYRNKLLGVVTLNALHGSTIRARKFSGPVLPLGDNLVRDSVFINAQNVGVYARGANDTVVENVSVFNTVVDAGIAGDQDLSEGAPCSANPNGCSIAARNVLSVGNKGMGMRVDTTVMNAWSLEDSDLYGNAGGNFPTSETPGDDAGNIRRSKSIAPTGMGAGKCLLWVPDDSNMKHAGAGGADIGGNVLRRYQDGVLTSERLWDATTGAFPCGATVAGVNDDPARTCSGVHARLNVNTNGCAFPAGY